MLIDAPVYKTGKDKDKKSYVEKIQAEQSDWEKMLGDIPVINNKNE